MSMTPKSLATILQTRCRGSTAVDHVGEIKPFAGSDGLTFYVHDNTGGILRVNVSQYKSPVR
jgi:hypothetical protein